MTADELKKMPKVELHCHLDGSLSKQFIEQRLQRTVSNEELMVSGECSSLVEYLDKFELPCSCLKDEEGLEAAGYDILKSMSLENVCYAEIRFAPLLSVTKEMDVEKVIAAILRGLNRGKDEFGIEYNVIVCAMRHHKDEENYQMLKQASKFLGHGVCGADLAGAEARYPMFDFMELFRKTKALSIPFTIHAGECGSVQNILDALTAGAKRIGHGIAMAGKPAVQKIVADARLGVEMCPTSNLQTKAVQNMEEYPLREFLDAGILVTINTDNRTVSGTTMTGELELIQHACGITDEEIITLMRNAVEVSFASPEIKKKLRQILSE